MIVSNNFNNIIYNEKALTEEVCSIQPKIEVIEEKGDWEVHDDHLRVRNRFISASTIMSFIDPNNELIFEYIDGTTDDLKAFDFNGGNFTDFKLFNFSNELNPQDKGYQHIPKGGQFGRGKIFGANEEAFATDFTLTAQSTTSFWFKLTEGIKEYTVFRGAVVLKVEPTGGGDLVLTLKFGDTILNSINNIQLNRMYHCTIIRNARTWDMLLDYKVDGYSLELSSDRKKDAPAIGERPISFGPTEGLVIDQIRLFPVAIEVSDNTNNPNKPHSEKAMDLYTREVLSYYKISKKPDSTIDLNTIKDKLFSAPFIAIDIAPTDTDIVVKPIRKVTQIKDDEVKAYNIPLNHNKLIAGNKLIDIPPDSTQEKEYIYNSHLTFHKSKGLQQFTFQNNSFDDLYKAHFNKEGVKSVKLKGVSLSSDIVLLSGKYTYIHSFDLGQIPLQEGGTSDSFDDSRRKMHSFVYDGVGLKPSTNYTEQAVEGNLVKNSLIVTKSKVYCIKRSTDPTNHQPTLQWGTITQLPEETQGALTFDAGSETIAHWNQDTPLPNYLCTLSVGTYLLFVFANKILGARPDEQGAVSASSMFAPTGVSQKDFSSGETETPFNSIRLGNLLLILFPSFYKLYRIGEVSVPSGYSGSIIYETLRFTEINKTGTSSNKFELPHPIDEETTPLVIGDIIVFFLSDRVHALQIDLDTGQPVLDNGEPKVWRFGKFPYKMLAALENHLLFAKEEKRFVGDDGVALAQGTYDTTLYFVPFSQGWRTSSNSEQTITNLNNLFTDTSVHNNLYVTGGDSTASILLPKEVQHSEELSSGDVKHTILYDKLVKTGNKLKVNVVFPFAGIRVNKIDVTPLVRNPNDNLEEGAVISIYHSPIKRLEYLENILDTDIGKFIGEHSDPPTNKQVNEQNADLEDGDVYKRIQDSTSSIDEDELGYKRWSAEDDEWQPLGFGGGSVTGRLEYLEKILDTNIDKYIGEYSTPPTNKQVDDQDVDLEEGDVYKRIQDDGNTIDEDELGYKSYNAEDDEWQPLGFGGGSVTGRLEYLEKILDTNINKYIGEHSTPPTQGEGGGALVDGDVYKRIQDSTSSIDEDDLGYKRYNAEDNEWQPLGFGGGGDDSVFVGDSQPPKTSIGQIWFNPSSNKIMIKMNGGRWGEIIVWDEPEDLYTWFNNL